MLNRDNPGTSRHSPPARAWRRRRSWTAWRSGSRSGPPAASSPPSAAHSLQRLRVKSHNEKQNSNSGWKQVYSYQQTAPACTFRHMSITCETQAAQPGSPPVARSLTCRASCSVSACLRSRDRLHARARRRGIGATIQLRRKATPCGCAAATNAASTPANNSAGNRIPAVSPSRLPAQPFHFFIPALPLAHRADSRLDCLRRRRLTSRSSEMPCNAGWRGTWTVQRGKAGRRCSTLNSGLVRKQWCGWVKQQARVSRWPIKQGAWEQAQAMDSRKARRQGHLRPCERCHMHVPPGWR